MALDPEFAQSPLNVQLLASNRSIEPYGPAEKFVQGILTERTQSIYEFTESQMSFIRQALKAAYCSGSFDGALDMAKIGVAR